MSASGADSSLEQEMEVLLLVGPLMLAAVGFGLYRSLQLQKKMYDTYTLTISEHAITREQHNMARISLPVASITGITRNSNGTFTIRGATPQDLIGVYKQVDAYEALEAQLNSLSPVVVQTKPPLAQKLYVPLILLALGLMAAVYLGTNKVLVGVSGAALTALLGWSFFYLQRSPLVDHATRRNRWWTLLVLFAIIATTIGKLLAE